MSQLSSVASPRGSQKNSPRGKRANAKSQLTHIHPLDEVLNTEPDENDIMNLNFQNNSLGGRKLSKVKSSKKTLKKDISGVKLRKSPKFGNQNLSNFDESSIQHMAESP